jgi:hypothetical protein
MQPPAGVRPFDPALPVAGAPDRRPATVGLAGWKRRPQSHARRVGYRATKTSLTRVKIHANCIVFPGMHYS